jgi:beta-glucan synthesis-associated protein KRE6
MEIEGKLTLLALVIVQPFNAYYQWFNTSDNLIINDPEVTWLNMYQGAEFQQATSAVSITSEH